MTRTTRTLTKLMFTLLLALLAAPDLTAQPKSSSRLAPLDQARLQRVMASTANVEDFRQEYAAYLAELEMVTAQWLESSFARELMARHGLNPQEQLEQARLRVLQLNEQELTGLKSALGQSLSWRELPRQLETMLKPEVAAVLKSLSAAPGDPLPGGVSPDRCSDAFLNGNPRISNTDISAATAVVIALSAIADALPTDFLTVAAKIAPVAARAAAEGILLTLETLKNISDDCSGRDFEDSVSQSFTGVNNNIATRASQTSVNTLQTTANTISNDVKSVQATVGQTQTAVNEINAKVDVRVSTRATMAQVNTLQGTANTINTKTDLVLTRLDDIEALLRAFQAENLRLQIELNLLQGPRYNLAQFQMPASAGGRLELVRAIVDDTITKGALIGVPQSVINQAKNQLNMGDVNFTAKNFKDAYANFRTAYLLIATNPAMHQP